MATDRPAIGGAPAFTATLRQHETEVPELYAKRAPEPSVNAWNFTTSTLVPLQQNEAAPAPSYEWTAPDEAGTHVLVVIYLGS